MNNRNHLCLVLLAALALPASELNAQQAPGFVSAGCEAVAQASAQGKAQANARVSGLGAAQMGNIASQRSCMEAFGDSASRAIVELGGMDLSGLASMALETACQVVVKKVNDAVGDVTSQLGLATGTLNQVVSGVGQAQALIARVPANAQEFYAAVADPANRGMQVPWPRDISGFPQSVQQSIQGWQNQNLNVFDQSLTRNLPVIPSYGGTTDSSDGQLFDRVACTLFGRC